MMELEPCPFCGKEAHTYIRRSIQTICNDELVFKVGCYPCGIYQEITKRLVDLNFETAQAAMKEVTAKWNRRADNGNL